MRAMHVDFIRPRPAPLWGWLLLAMGATAIAAAALPVRDTLARQAAHDRLVQARKAEDERQKQLQAASQVVASPSYTQDPRWQHAAHQLAHPWLATLQALEQATKPPVFLLALRADAANGTFEMDAEASQFSEALAFVSTLRADPRLKDVELGSHESIQDAQSRPLVRFTVRAAWRGGKP